MTEFNRTHAAIFDELERQGLLCVDIAKLTRAVLAAHETITSIPSTPRLRCANGACDE